MRRRFPRDWPSWLGLVLLLGFGIWSSPAGAASPPTATVTASAVKQTGHKLALVIGNSNYQTHPLKNAVNDAVLIAKTLSDVGFDVVQGTDLSQRQMYRLLDEFRDKAQSADVALIYYAGHGVQVRGTNYLIPIELVAKDEFDITSRGVNLDRIVDMFKTERGRINIIVVDACRDNPFGSARSFGSKGLAEIQSKPGTLIAYSTSPGNTATDSAAPGGGNSIYSFALANAIASPGLSIEEAFKTVRREVLRATGGKQTPWEVTSLVVSFSFNPDGKLVTRAGNGLATSSPVLNGNRLRSVVEEAGDEPFPIPPEEARQELARMGVAWTNEAFANSVKEGDVITAKLFIQGGKSLFSMAGSQAVIGYLACGEERAKMARMLHKQGIDLNGIYDRRYRIEGVSITERMHILPEWLSECPAKDDVEFARELVSAGVKWPVDGRLEAEPIKSWAFESWRARESMKILIRAGAIDPGMNNYLIYRLLKDSRHTRAKEDAEFVALIAPKDRARFDHESAQKEAALDEGRRQEQAGQERRNLENWKYSVTCNVENPRSMQPFSECVEQKKKENRSK